ncbi:MAG: hypothetical protein KGI29_05350 [Pseudomonadota bacterium]|nr:hypothetical protein [Pseudomonadota bacterium]
MSDITTLRNIGAIVVPVTGVFPQNAAAGTINGASIDRMLHNMAGSCVLHQVVGAETGAPTAASVQTKLQDSPDNSTWSDYKAGTATVQETAALTAANSENTAAIDLTGANRFIRPVTIISFTGGTSPEIQVAAGIILGGERELAAV